MASKCTCSQPFHTEEETASFRIRKQKENIEMPPQKLKVFKEKSNRAKTAQLRAVSKELADTRSTALQEISFPIRKGSTSGRKGVVQ